jgi:hypothetical protein
VHEHHTCGKCHSPDILSIAATATDHSGVVVGSRLMHTVPVTKYVCTGCGFIEEWVSSKDDLRRLKEQMH